MVSNPQSLDAKLSLSRERVGCLRSRILNQPSSLALINILSQFFVSDP